jgi:hypothetical protein
VGGAGSAGSVVRKCQPSGIVRGRIEVG